jgi:hypothetical membrane protein
MSPKADPHTDATVAGLRVVRRWFPTPGPALWMLSFQYFVVQIVVGWVWHPRYSVTRNTISDLGNTACGRYGGSYVCSPRHGVMNVSFMALGCAMAAGSWLVSRQFSTRPLGSRMPASIGLSCLALAGLGTFLVGLFPENTDRVMHLVGAGLGIGVGNVGILVLGLFLLQLPPGLRVTMVLLGAVSIVALLLFASHGDLGLGPGGMERIAAYPQTLWLIGFGSYLATRHLSASPSAVAQVARHGGA